MKNYKGITYRYLKGQRNRTLLTIFGIILSVALISAIGTMIVSVRDVMIKDAIEQNGSHHARFVNIDKETVEKLRNHVGVEEVGLSQAQASAAIKETTEQERSDFGVDIPYRYIEIEAHDKNTIGMLPINLKEGRLPETPDEIIIEYWMTNYFDEEIKLGDKIKLPLGKRLNAEGKDISQADLDDDSMRKENFQQTGEKEYTLVGFIKPRYVWKGDLITQGIIGFDENTITNDNYDAYFSIPDLKNAQEKISNIAKDVGVNEDNIETNYRVLRLYAENISETFNKSLMAILAFVVVLIVVCTIAVIYNAFNISVLERTSQFGLLRSIGATPKQIRGLVLKEAAILSVIAIPIGLFSGVFAMKVVLNIIGLLRTDLGVFNELQANISASVFLISSMVGLITVFLSAIGPAKQAGKVSPLEAVRNTGQIKKEAFKKAGNSKIIRKTLGIEGEIAYKNLKRNRKRFLITVFSMVISIVLFITFSTFSDFMFEMGVVSKDNMGDFQVFGNLDDKSDEAYNRLLEMEDVDKVYKIVRNGGEVLLEDHQINKKMLDISPSYIFDEKVNGLTQIHNIEISSIGDDNLKELKTLLNSGAIDVDKMNKEKGVLVINNTYAYKGNSNERVLMEGYHLKVGDKIPFASYSNDDGDEDRKYEELTVVGVLERGIFDDKYNYNGSINMVTTEEVWDDLYQGDNTSGELREPYVNMHIEMTKNGKRENITKYLEELEDKVPGIHYIDAVEMAKEARTINIVLSIFLYGFVTIISLISAINIINTISTNIILRTKEIAMIKAVGMSQARIKRMVALESLFYGLYATIFGGAIGTGLTYVLYKLTGGIGEFQYKLPWQNIAIACIGAIIIALLSGVYPLKRINDKIIVESMKAEN